MRISDWSSDVCSSDLNIRITPSKLGDIPLSEKSIPFYYKVAEGTDRLFQYWDHNKTIKDRADQNLSYRADEYNGGDEHIRKPLLYDLKPHNFLRIEGHLGKQYTAALRNLLRKIGHASYRERECQNV